MIEDARGPIGLGDLAVLDRGDVNGFDRSAIDNYSITPSSSSDYFRDGFALAPMLMYLSSDIRKMGWTYLLMYGEVAALNSGLTNFTKAAFGRYRPYAYNPDVPLAVKLASTTRRSFYSGHVSHVASMSFFMAQVFSDMYPDSDYTYIVWSAAVVTPAVTSYLRYKAGKHFLTDVLAGYGMGALVGYLIPRLHRSTSNSNVSNKSSNDQLGLVWMF